MTSIVAPPPVEPLVSSVIEAFFEVYGVLGHGFLESVYARALELELRARGAAAEREVAADVRYKGRVVGRYRADLVVERVLVLELKAAPRTRREDMTQLFNYLRATGLREGLLLGFGERPQFFRVRDRRAGVGEAAWGSSEGPDASRSG